LFPNKKEEARNMPMNDKGEWVELADELMPNFSDLGIPKKIESEKLSFDDEHSRGTSHDDGREYRMRVLGDLLGHPIEFTCL
jgi:hypothetical protein